MPTRRCQFVLFMQMTTFSTCKTKPNLQVKAKKSVCITSKLLLFSIFFFDLMGDIMHGMANMTNGVSNMSYVVAGQHDQIDKVTSHTHDLKVAKNFSVLGGPLN